MIKLKDILNEVENSVDASISKQEEQYAIDYYKKIILPKDVYQYNSNVGPAERRIKGVEPTTVDAVIKNLRKLKHFRTDNVFPDKIIYKSTIGSAMLYKDIVSPITFVVEIDKEKGKLIIRHSVPFLTLIFKTPVTEGVEDRITKLDEQYAYTYMLRYIVPFVLYEQYYKHIKKTPALYPERKYPRNIEDRDIIKKLRKIRTDFDRIEYESVMNDNMSFEFIIVKEQHLDQIVGKKETWSSHMMCGGKGPWDVEYKWYDINYTPTVIKENTERVNPISKMDEQYAVLFIRKELIPLIVNLHNEACKQYTHQPEAAVDDVNRTLRKIKRGKTPSLGADEIIYQALIYNGTNNEPYEFRIYKNYKGNVFVDNRGHGTSHIVL